MVHHTRRCCIDWLNPVRSRALWTGDASGRSRTFLVTDGTGAEGWMVLKDSDDREQ